MSPKPQKSLSSADEKMLVKPALTQQENPDERFPGSFFRIPGVPLPGKTTWSLVK